MTFTDPIIGGESKLIREAIQSPNYVPGTAGWTINKDGSYEFGPGGTIRGDLLIIGADGSQVAVLTGGDARIEFQPPIDAAYTRLFSGSIRADINKFGAFQGNTVLGISTPDGQFTGNNVTEASITMKSSRSDFVPHLPFGPAVRPEIVLSGDTWFRGSAYADNDIRSEGLPVPICQMGTELVTFAAATNFNVNVNFGTSFPTGKVPNVAVNIASGSGVTRWFKVKADTFTETGFRLLGDTTDAAAAAVAWANIPVTWVATYVP